VNISFGSLVAGRMMRAAVDATGSGRAHPSFSPIALRGLSSRRRCTIRRRLAFCRTPLKTVVQYQRSCRLDRLQGADRSLI
jgi:hypothetical protein